MIIFVFLLLAHAGSMYSSEKRLCFSDHELSLKLVRRSTLVKIVFLLCFFEAFLVEFHCLDLGLSIFFPIRAADMSRTSHGCICCYSVAYCVIQLVVVLRFVHLFWALRAPFATMISSFPVFLSPFLVCFALASAAVDVLSSKSTRCGEVEDMLLYGQCCGSSHCCCLLLFMDVHSLGCEG